MRPEQVVCAYAEPVAGPGWSNRPLWFIWREDGTHTLHQECIQPEDQTPEMHALYAVSSVVHQSMRDAVRQAIFSAKSKRYDTLRRLDER